jgi:hypothetical protein
LCLFCFSFYSFVHGPAVAELGKADDLIREVGHLLAEAIREIVSLYQDKHMMPS